MPSNNIHLAKVCPKDDKTLAFPTFLFQVGHSQEISIQTGTLKSAFHKDSRRWQWLNYPTTVATKGLFKFFPYDTTWEDI